MAASLLPQNPSMQRAFCGLTRLRIENGCGAAFIAAAERRKENTLWQRQGNRFAPSSWLGLDWGPCQGNPGGLAPLDLDKTPQSSPEATYRRPKRKTKQLILGVYTKRLDTSELLIETPGQSPRCHGSRSGKWLANYRLFLSYAFHQKRKSAARTLPGWVTRSLKAK